MLQRSRSNACQRHSVSGCLHGAVCAVPRPSRLARAASRAPSVRIDAMRADGQGSTAPVDPLNGCETATLKELCERIKRVRQ